MAKIELTPAQIIQMLDAGLQAAKSGLELYEATKGAFSTQDEAEIKRRLAAFQTIVDADVDAAIAKADKAAQSPG